MIRIRLSRTGRKNRHSYRIIVASSKSPRDGKFIEKLGFFNIFDKNNICSLNVKKFIFWKNSGAKISEKVKFLIKKYKLL